MDYERATFTIALRTWLVMTAVSGVVWGAVVYGASELIGAW